MGDIHFTPKDQQIHYRFSHAIGAVCNCGIQSIGYPQSLHRGENGMNSLLYHSKKRKEVLVAILKFMVKHSRGSQYGPTAGGLLVMSDRLQTPTPKRGQKNVRLRISEIGDMAEKLSKKGLMKVTVTKETKNGNSGNQIKMWAIDFGYGVKDASNSRR